MYIPSTAIASALIVMSGVALAATAEPAKAPAKKEVAAASVLPEGVHLRGGTATAAQEPAALWPKAGKPEEASFKRLYELSKTDNIWVVQAVTKHAEHSRLILQNKDGSLNLGMDAADIMVKAAKIGKDTEIKITSESANGKVLLKFMAGKIPVGFMLDDVAAIAE